MARDPEDKDLTFIGTGWSFPFQFDPITGGAKKVGVGVNQVSALSRIRQSIQHIVNTGLRERCMRPDFGSGLRDLLFEPNDLVLIGMAQTTVIDALDRWEPRITLGRTGVNQDVDRGMLVVSVSYRINETNTTDNFVFPFYLFDETQSL